MANNPVTLLLLSGIGLAALYAVVSLGQPSDSAGAFTAAQGAGGALIAVSVAALIAYELWQGKKMKN